MAPTALPFEDATHRRRCTEGDRVWGVDAHRLQKILSAAGVASRRTAETLITQGRVTVNGRTVTELGTKAEPGVDEIKVDGRRLPQPKHTHYLLLNKPRGYITSRSDPQHRPTVIDLLARGGAGHIYPWEARLRFGSGCFLTSDGVHGLTHPAARRRAGMGSSVRGVPDRHALDRLARGGLDRRPPDRDRRSAPRPDLRV
jgi:23S rRNA pseudouridine2605 synthase